MQSHSWTACLYGAHFSSSVTWNGHVRNIEALTGGGTHSYAIYPSQKVLWHSGIAPTPLNKNLYHGKFNLWLIKCICLEWKPVYHTYLQREKHGINEDLGFALFHRRCIVDKSFISCRCNIGRVVTNAVCVLIEIAGESGKMPLCFATEWNDWYQSHICGRLAFVKGALRYSHHHIHRQGMDGMIFYCLHRKQWTY